MIAGRGNATAVSDLRPLVARLGSAQQLHAVALSVYGRIDAVLEGRLWFVILSMIRVSHRRGSEPHLAFRPARTPLRPQPGQTTTAV